MSLQTGKSTQVVELSNTNIKKLDALLSCIKDIHFYKDGVVIEFKGHTILKSDGYLIQIADQIHLNPDIKINNNFKHQIDVCTKSIEEK